MYSLQEEEEEFHFSQSNGQQRSKWMEMNPSCGILWSTSETYTNGQGMRNGGAKAGMWTAGGDAEVWEDTFRPNGGLITHELKT